MNLEGIRREIDAIDEELVKLFVRRMKAVEAVAASKHDTGRPVRDPAREQAILSRVAHAVDADYANAAKDLFSELMSISRRHQHDLIDKVKTNGESAPPLSSNHMKPYNCVVCIKQVPDTKMVTGEAMKEDGTVNRAALPAIFNPDDRNALEAALRVKDACGGTVTVVTMGLPAAKAVLREALCCGADRAVLVTDRKAAGSDTLATSYILSRAVMRFKPDLVFCGRQAIDGDTAQVGPQIGEKLGYAVVTGLEKILEVKDEGEGEARKSFVTAVRDIGTGVETCRVKLPALFTVGEKFGELLPFQMRRVM